MPSSFIIAIDGSAASGKGTLASRLADHYGFAHMDTGLLYRGVGMLAKALGKDPDNEEEAVYVAEKFVNHYDRGVSDGYDLKSDDAGPLASRVGKHPKVRQILFDLQRDFGLKAQKGAILDGRDIGTVIFPEADIKIYVTADIEKRAERRWNELTKKSKNVEYDAILQDMIERDKRDSSRSVAPMKPADDAVIVDTTDLSIEETFAHVLSIVEKKYKNL